MLIDWFTVCAQVVNFLVLAALLKRFLYAPILRAIDAREARIAAQLAAAAQTQAEALAERAAFQRKNQDFEQQRAALFSQANREAHAEQRRLVEEARRTVDALRARWQDTLKTEQQSLHQEITRRTQREVFAIARQVLRDLAAVELDARMAELLMQRLHALDQTALASLSAAVQASPEPVLVRSAFELSPPLQTAMTDAVQTALGQNISLQFVVQPDRIGGIELCCNGYKLAWSIADYLTFLEKSLSELLQQTTVDVVS